MRALLVIDAQKTIVDFKDFHRKPVIKQRIQK